MEARLLSLFLFSDFSYFYALLSRIVCPGEGLPSQLVEDMFDNSQTVKTMTVEGLGLSTCRKLLQLMNGEVHYARESGRCYFLVAIELPTFTTEHTAEEVGTCSKQVV